MKKCSSLAIAISGLALLIWWGFYLLYPDYALNKSETSVIVGGSLVFVILADVFWRWLGRRLAGKSKP